MLVFNDTEEKLVEKVITALDNIVTLKVLQPPHSPAMIFPGLEIRQSQHRVLQGGKEVNLTRLEFNTLVFLASNPGIVLTQEQIFQAVWNMASDSCHSSVVNVIYNLRKKIEPDSKNPVYIKTVLGVGYKFDVKNAGE